MNANQEILSRIQAGLEEARHVLSRFTSGEIHTEYKSGHDPVTEADRAVDAVLHRTLLRPEEGWLSEESVDDLVRLERRHVWVVDPLDGTREFVEGIPEWCVSVAFVEDGRAIAGGICNPATDELIVGSLEAGVFYNGQPARTTERASVDGATVLASRSEMKRGEWDVFQNSPLQVKPMGSVAYKLGLVAAGKADATWTLTPKHEWDVAAGVALVESGGGTVRTLDDSPVVFNRRKPKLSGLIATGSRLAPELLSLLKPHLKTTVR
jgi:myo-inositol-1(or 4)-monophosphatase